MTSRSSGSEGIDGLDGRIAGIAGASIERRRVPHRLDRSPTDRARRSTGCDRASPTLDQTRPTPTPAPAPPPWGDPGGPISLRIPVFFGFLWGVWLPFLGGLVCGVFAPAFAALSWAGALASLGCPRGIRVALATCLLVFGALLSSHRVSVLPSVALR